MDNKVNGVEVPDTNNDNDTYDELTHIPEDDFVKTESIDNEEVAAKDAFNSEPVTLTTTKELTQEEAEALIGEEDISVEEAKKLFDEDWEDKINNQPVRKVKSINEGLVSIGNVLSDISDEELTFDGDYEVGVEDVKKCVEDSTISAPDYELSEEAALEIVKLINKLKEDKTFLNRSNIYNEFPDELKKMIDQHLLSVGIIPTMKSNEVRFAKNSIAKSLLSEFSAYIEMNSVQKNFNAEMENIFKEMGTNISSLYKDYNKERDNYLREILSKVPAEDITKKELISATLDAIHDSYTLNRLKEGVPKMKKVRKIEIEKPRTRVFSNFESKYRTSPYNMYSLDIALNILDKYNYHEDDPQCNLRFLLAFCKFCDNYNPNVIPEHSFMFYTIYNIITLDIYKGEDYEGFATEFLKNINEVISYIKYDK